MQSGSKATCIHFYIKDSTSCSIMFLTFFSANIFGHQSLLLSLFVLAVVIFHQRMCHCLFGKSPVDGYLGHFQHLAITNNAAVHILVQISLNTCVSKTIQQIPGNGIVGPSMCMFNIFECLFPHILCNTMLNFSILANLVNFLMATLHCFIVNVSHYK